MPILRGDIFRVIAATHPMLREAAASRARLIVEAVQPLDGLARIAFLDAAGDKTAAAVLRLEHLEAAFLLREDLASTAGAPTAESVWRAMSGRPLAASGVEPV